MQSIFIDITSHPQLGFAKLPGHCIVIQADSMFSAESTTPTIGLLTLFHLVEHGKSNIAYLL